MKTFTSCLLDQLHLHPETSSRDGVTMPPNLAPFQRHLGYYATSPSGPPPRRITLLSALEASLQLGLNFPVSLALAIGMRLYYSSNLIRPVNVDALPTRKHRTQLEHMQLGEDNKQQGYSASDLIESYDAADRQGAQPTGLDKILDKAHLYGFWAMAADTKTNMLSRGDLKRFQHGDWQEDVVSRRRGRQDVLPFWRGGPIGVGGHSWAVKTFFDVRVYEK